nr:uncharacterized protein LOC129384499 [Dermacentor andersoni]
MKKNSESTQKKSQLPRAANELKLKTKLVKHIYFNETLPNLINDNPNRSWNFFRTRPATTPHRPCEEKLALTDKFNQHFQSVFTKDNDTIPYLPPSSFPTVDTLTINDSGIFKQLLELDVKKANGPDNIPNEFFKGYAECNSEYLGLINRKSLSMSDLPEDYKIAKIVPIHKSGNTNLPSNYRPISLTSTSCKILEHIILKHLTAYFEEHILVDVQHGFRRGLSTVTQLTEVVHDLALSINNHNQTNLLLLDFSKAFVCVGHTKLTAKITAAIGNGPITAWIKTFYLTDPNLSSSKTSHQLQCLSHQGSHRTRY